MVLGIYKLWVMPNGNDNVNLISYRRQEYDSIKRTSTKTLPKFKPRVCLLKKYHYGVSEESTTLQLKNKLLSVFSHPQAQFDKESVRLLHYRETKQHVGDYGIEMEESNESEEITIPITRLSSDSIDGNNYINIPPPAGFDSPTRPSTLLAALVRGPISLDESSLSPATQRRIAYIHRHTKSSFGLLSSRNGEKRRPSHELLNDLTASPISPPSPFQHPFFQRQLGLFPDPWSRFSGFGFTRFSPLINHPKEGSSESDLGENCDSAKVVNNSVQPSSNLCYCEENQSYQRIYNDRYTSERYSDGVSETESEDDDDLFASPIGSIKTSIVNNNHLQKSNEPDGNKRNSYGFLYSENETFKKSTRLSQGDVEGDDVSSFTASEADSFNDSHSTESHSRYHSLEREQPDGDVSLSLDGSRKDKAQRIALELLHTEKSYVQVLHLIDQEFQFKVDQENKVHHLFSNEQIPLIFSNIKSIYKLHHDFLLPQLEDRMANWESSSKIGDIMKNFAPFLKMYTEYVRNFDNAMTLINYWQSKSQRFSAIMDEIHRLESCGNLTLQHHMLSPVQRIPRYEMLLKDYLRRLPEDHLDRANTEEALHLVSTAANHANDAMKKIDKFEKLLAVQESLGGALEIVSPTRELLKEGRIIKISARSGDHQERYLFLFSDILLLCTPRLISGRVISGPTYKLRAKFNVENLQVLEGDNLETANTFYVRDNNKTVELYTQTKEEKDRWLDALFSAVNETFQRKSSLRLVSHSDSKSEDLGVKQPTFVKMDTVTKCQRCSCQFSVMKRKHHCRACGCVVCSKCSSQKISLSFENGKNVRVCRSCHQSLEELRSGANSPLSDTDDKDVPISIRNSEVKKSTDIPFKSRGILEMSTTAPGAIIEGSLLLKTHRKSWVKRWFSLHQDFVLYSFKSENESFALTATPVPGFTVSVCRSGKGESSVSEKDKEKCFKLFYSKKQYIFQAQSKEDAVRWVAALERASKAELPVDQ